MHADCNRAKKRLASKEEPMKEVKRLRGGSGKYASQGLRMDENSLWRG